ncbi:hypothetical protein ABT160_24190 [Streptomyces sp. NPDC001941]|uniref:hypothetical protein n=1 Tax=Streptomyces sp. NPDC001941 TaxID=3154659 RepID=UPI0033181474
MDSTAMPEPLRRAVHQLVAETVQNCQDVLAYTERFAARDWKRMTLYRSTDAADTMNMAAMLIAAHCQRAGMPAHTLERYLQVGQQELRSAAPLERDRAYTAGLAGEPLSYVEMRAPSNRMQHSLGQEQAEEAQLPVEEPLLLFTEACLHGLRARLSEDLDSLDDYLPPQMARMARRVAEALEMPELATM